MRYSKWIKLGAVGLAALLIPRRSSRQSIEGTASNKNAKQADLATLGRSSESNSKNNKQGVTKD